MSSDERWILIGKAVGDYNESRRKLAALRLKAQGIGKSMRRVTEYLCRRDVFPVRPGEIASDLQALPDGAVIRDLVGQIEAAVRARDGLYRTLRELGAEPKE